MAGHQSQRTAAQGEDPLEQAVRSSLRRYRSAGDLRALGEAFAAARAATAATRRATADADADGVSSAERRRYSRLPAVEELIDAVTDRAQALVEEELCRLWVEIGAAGRPPRWSEAERASARRTVALAVVAEESQALPGMVAAVRRVAASRLAREFVLELQRSGEAAWRRLLAERYSSVLHRCAPRRGVRPRQLHRLLDEEPALRQALTDRLTAWLRAGAAPGGLADTVEGVVVHHRTPIYRA